MIRIATTVDLPRIVEIYNQVIAKKFQTADTEPVSVANRQVWFAGHEGGIHPILVSELDNKVVAWVSISPY
jgi:phosphinothricin acetyltransferase